MQDKKIIALILAGRRRGGDALSPPPDETNTGQLSHKAFIDIDGQMMIERVLRCLSSISQIDEIWIAAPDDIKVQLSEIPNISPTPIYIDAAGSPALTINDALMKLPEGAQMLVTTCDHPLLTKEMITSFLSSINNETQDIAVACVEKATYEAAYPTSKRTFITFRDVAFSGANLFWMKAGAANPLIQFWRDLEDNRKKPLKMATEIGIITGIQYFLGRLTKAQAIKRLLKKTGVRAELIALKNAEAAIDVDKPEDITLVHAILKARPSE